MIVPIGELLFLAKINDKNFYAGFKRQKKLLQRFQFRFRFFSLSLSLFPVLIAARETF